MALLAPAGRQEGRRALTHKVLGNVCVDGARPVRHHIVLCDLSEERRVEAVCSAQQAGQQCVWYGWYHGAYAAGSWRAWLVVPRCCKAVRNAQHNQAA